MTDQGTDPFPGALTTYHRGVHVGLPGSVLLNVAIGLYGGHDTGVVIRWQRWNGATERVAHGHPVVKGYCLKPR